MAESPSWKEFKGYYNISPSLIGEADDKTRFFCKILGLRLPTSDECDSVVAGLMGLGEKLGIPEGKLYFDINYFDRTIFAAPRVPRFFNEEFVCGVQRQLLGAHPLWRAVMVACDDEKTFVVYPDEIRFNNPNADLRDELKQIREAAETYLDQTDGAKSRQLGFIKQKLKSMSLPSYPFDPVVLAVFDRPGKAANFVAVWLLSDRRYNEKSWLPNYKEFGWKGGIEAYDVDDAGNVADPYSFDSRFLGYLSSESFDKNVSGDCIRLRNPNTGEVVTHRISKVISDEELKANAQ